jgi:aminoglycoside 2'-N-acetyltransferase I
VTSLRLARSSELTDRDWEVMTALCIAAFNEPWDSYWQDIGPGLHVLAEEAKQGIVAHAAIVDRPLYPGTRVVQAGYVEAVAVWPDRQGSGLGTLVMTEIDRLIDDAYELGALGTGGHHFYQRLGWKVWRGPTWIRHRDGRRERSVDEDGDIMVRLTPRSPPDLDLWQPIAVDWRPGEVW